MTNMAAMAAYSAVKIEVRDVSTSCDSKVLVLSHESSTRDVITSLLRKLKMRESNPALFVIEAEILADQDLAILQFEDDDKLMQAYHQFPKGSMKLCMRHKSEFDMDIADEKRAGKTGVNGHQLTLQRIRRSLEKLKRKSGTVTSSSSTSGTTTTKSSAGSHAGSSTARERSSSDSHQQPLSARSEKYASRGSLAEAPTTPRSARPPPKPHSPARQIKSQGVSASTNATTTTRGGQLVTSQSDKTLTPSQQQNGGISDRRREYRNRTERSRRRSYAGDENGGHKSPYSLSSKQLSYKSTTVPYSGPAASGAASDTDCMIFYDSASEHGGSVSHIPTAASASSLTSPRSHVIAPQAVKPNMIDKPAKMSFRNLEDSGIDVKSPPVLSAGKIRDRVNSMNDMDHAKPVVIKQHTPNLRSQGNSQESYLSPTLSESSPLSFTSANEANHVKRTGSFSSLKSLPVTVFKEPDGSPYMFEPIGLEKSRSKSQSMTNLHNNKVIRRRSLPPLDVSQEKLEQKKSSLSKRLAKKISNFRNNEKRYMLPSPHNFTQQQNMQHYKSPDRDKRSVSDNARKPNPVIDIQDDADMEVACILEGKPEHPTDSDVEDYLACVESTNTTQSESRHGDIGEPVEESTPYSHLDKPSKHHSKSKHSSNNEDVFSPVHSDKYHLKPHSHSKQEPSNGMQYIDHNSNSKYQSKTQVQAPPPNISAKPEPKYSAHESVNGPSKDISKSIDSGIESSYTRGSGHVDKSNPVNGAVPKKKKHINKFVEQSMQSFLHDCHQGTLLSDSDILDMHHAALQNSIPSPYRDMPNTADSKSPAKPEMTSPQQKVTTSLNLTPSKQQTDSSPSSPKPMTEYEKARARFLSQTSMDDKRDGIPKPYTPPRRNSDTTYKTNVQLTLQSNIPSPASKSNGSLDNLHDKLVPPPQSPMRRKSQDHDRTVVAKQIANDVSPKPDIPDEEWASKPLTLYTIIRTHAIVSIFMEKGGNKSFGIKVKRVLFTSRGAIKESSASNNVVAVQELSPNSPAETAASLVLDDVIIEVNGHNVLQSSDKVVRTLLDARSALEMVVARAKSQQKLVANHVSETSNTSRSPPVVFHNMEDITTNHTTTTKQDNNQVTLTPSSRSRTYEQRSKAYEKSPENVPIIQSARSRAYEHRSKAYEQSPENNDPQKWNSNPVYTDALVNSPRFNQLSEGPTFLL